MKFIKSFFSDAKEGILVLFYAVKDKKTPLYAKLLTVTAALYLLSPIDFLPDAFIPFGFLDDIAIVPSLFYLVYKSIPQEILAKAKEKARKTNKTINRSIAALFIAAGLAVILFLILLYFLYKLLLY
jgi:Uncharacterized conserved protein